MEATAVSIVHVRYKKTPGEILECDVIISKKVMRELERSVGKLLPPVFVEIDYKEIQKLASEIINRKLKIKTPAQSR